MRYFVIPLLLVSFAAGAQLPDPALTAKDRRQIAEDFAKVLETKYVLPDQAKNMAAAVRAQIRAGAYDNLEPASAFASALLGHARAVNDDKHLQLKVTPNVVPIESDEEKEKRMAPQMARQARRANFGLAKAERLDGNIGYLDIEVFPKVQFAGPAIDAALAFLGETDAMIIDARRHRGGDPETVAYFVSHFVAPGTLINTIYTRDNTEPDLFRATKLPTAPYSKKVYVLTSSKTFSAGEELTYDLQSLGRARVYGEVTGGGAHPTGAFRLHERVMAFVPAARSVNPITKTNWEGVGVKPDVPLPAADALRAAHVAALKDVAAEATDAAWRAEVEKIATRLASPAENPAQAADANPRTMLDAWMKSFNEHDAAAREQWLRANTAYTEDQAKEYTKMDQEIRAANGPFELVRVVRSEGGTIEAEARHTGSGVVARIEIVVDPKQPRRIANVALQPVEVKGNAGGPG